MSEKIQDKIMLSDPSNGQTVPVRLDEETLLYEIEKEFKGLDREKLNSIDFLHPSNRSKRKETDMVREIEDKPPFVVEFEQFLQSNKYFIRTVLQSGMDSTYIVRGEVAEESESFEVDFEFSEEFDYCHLTTSCLDSISPEKYPSCLELLNFINVHDSREKFSIFPDSHRLTCFHFIGRVEWEFDDYDFIDRIDFYSRNSRRSLVKLFSLLNKNLDLEEAIREFLEFLW